MICETITESITATEIEITQPATTDLITSRHAPRRFAIREDDNSREDPSLALTLTREVSVV